MSNACFLILCFTLLTRVECNVVNTGTVLFTTSDIHRKCWHPEEIAVLTTRIILQDLLPDVESLEITGCEYVDDIVEYFRLLFNVVQNMTEGRSRRIAMLALTDLIGGYLQHAVLPLARHAYYAGVLDFSSVEKLIQLYEELKWYLRTNGQGWMGPLQPKTEYDIEQIDLATERSKGNDTCCRNLIYYQRQPSKQFSSRDNPRTLFFPVPFFDSKVRPSAIAVPFRKFALRNIQSRKAAYMVMKYYISVNGCLKDLGAEQTAIDNFRDNLYTWIENNVLPKLGDDKFYSAFGGIMRVERSLKLQGAKLVTGNAECFENEGDQEIGGVPGGESTSRSSVLMVAMLVTILIWFIIGTFFICYRIKNNSKKAATNATARSTSSSSTCVSSSRWSSSRRTEDTCKCCATPTDKSSDMNSSVSSELDKEDEKNKSKSSFLKSFSFGGKSHKKEQTYSRSCLCPPTIDPKQSMKLLPSIPEISENSSTKREDWNKNKSKRISFGEPPPASSGEDVVEAKKPKSKIKVCVPRMKDIDISVCPHYEDKATFLSSSASKSTDLKEAGTDNSEVGADDLNKLEKSATKQEPVSPMTNDNTTGETTDNTGITANSPHIYACHSSLTGNYTRDQRFLTVEKPYIFGYDFQTSSSSEMSDEETDTRTSTTK